jgi:hypothetical protein
MTNIIIPNQPTHFKYCDVCDCFGVHCIDKQIAQFDDKFSFQIKDIDTFLRT